MPKPRAVIQDSMPEPGIPEDPALLFAERCLWVSYQRSGMDDNACAVIRFDDVIDYGLSPISDEGLGKHPYAKAGLRFYSFHEVVDTKEAKRWAVLGAHHWVVTFKDVTLDVIAKTVVLIDERVVDQSPSQALLSTFATSHSSI